MHMSSRKSTHPLGCIEQFPGCVVGVNGRGLEAGGWVVAMNEENELGWVDFSLRTRPCAQMSYIYVCIYEST